MTQESVGVAKTSLVMENTPAATPLRKSSRSSDELGENALEDAFARFKDLADRK